MSANVWDRFQASPSICERSTRLSNSIPGTSVRTQRNTWGRPFTLSAIAQGPTIVYLNIFDILHVERTRWAQFWYVTRSVGRVRGEPEINHVIVTSKFEFGQRFLCLSKDFGWSCCRTLKVRRDGVKCFVSEVKLMFVSNNLSFYLK